MLFHGGVNGSNPGDWFLRSDFVAPPITPPITPPVVVEPPNPLPPTPSPEPLLPGVAFPIIGPDLAAFGVAQPLARQLGLTTARACRRHLRTGLRRACDGAGEPADQEAGGGRPTRTPWPAPCPLLSP
jgi:hypothetical protein